MLNSEESGCHSRQKFCVCFLGQLWGEPLGPCLALPSLNDVYTHMKNPFFGSYHLRTSEKKTLHYPQLGEWGRVEHKEAEVASLVPSEDFQMSENPGWLWGEGCSGRFAGSL